MRSTRLAPITYSALLDADEERDLGDQIEAGVLAGALLAGELPRRVGADATDEELRALARRGELAWSRFFEANLRLVAQFAYDAARRSDLAVDDFFQEGCVALAEAMRRFDPRAGVRFSTYALPWVRNSVLQHLVRRGGSLETPVWRIREARRLRELRAQMEGERGGAVTLGELAHRVGRSRDWVWLTLEVDRHPGGLDELFELPCPRSSWPGERLGPDLPDWLDTLGSLESRVLSLRFGLRDGVERTPANCARVLGVSESTVRRVERRALARAREVLACEPAAA